MGCQPSYGAVMSTVRSLAVAVVVVVVLLAVPLLVDRSRSSDVSDPGSVETGARIDSVGSPNPTIRKAPPAGARFESGVVPFVVNLDAAPAGALDAVLAAADEWNQVELGIAFEFMGMTELSENAADEVNVIWWDPSVDPDASFIALTSNHWQDDTPQVLDGFDIVFRADRNFATDGRSDAWDLETVALHEFGHAIGLGHADLDRLLQVMNPQLSLGQTNRRLTARDVDRARDLYESPQQIDSGLFVADELETVAVPTDGGLFDSSGE